MWGLFKGKPSPTNDPILAPQNTPKNNPIVNKPVNPNIAKGNPNNYSRNQFLPEQQVYNRNWAQNRQKGFGVAQTSVRPLFNVDAPEDWTGMNNMDGGGYDPTKWTTTAGRVVSGTEGMIKSFRDNGGKGQINGISWEMTPEQKAFYEATLPMYQMGHQVKNVTDNVTNLVKDRSVMEAAGGYQQWYDNIQKGNNQQYQIAQAELQSKDPEVRVRGRQRIEMVANAQYVLNKSMPQVTHGIQQGINNKIQGVKNFVGNNWWWMLPAGGALLYGLGNLFGRGGQPMSQPGQHAVPMPSYWKTGFQQQTPQQPTVTPSPKPQVPSFDTQPTEQGF